MKKDTEVKLLMQERRKGTPQRLAAARAGMGERTARKYEQAGELPSQLKRPHTWATRDNPFEQDWPWVITQLERDPACKGPPCLRCSVSNTRVAIDRPKFGPCSGTLPNGVLCLGRSRKSSLNNDISPQSEPNPILPIWRIWA